MKNYRIIAIKFLGTRIGAAIFVLVFYVLLLPIVILKLLITSFIDALSRSFADAKYMLKEIFEEHIDIKYVMQMAYDMQHPEIAQVEMDRRMLNYKYNLKDDEDEDNI